MQGKHQPSAAGFTTIRPALGSTSHEPLFGGKAHDLGLLPSKQYLWLTIG